jgi:hypothetical protein
MLTRVRAWTRVPGGSIVVAVERQLDPEQVRLVLRRAAELERRPDRGEGGGGGGGGGEGLSSDEVSRIGAEVGLAPEAVRRALEEVRTGLIPAPASGATVLDRVLGPDEVVIERAVSGTVGGVRVEVDRFLTDQLLTVRRNFGDHALWQPAEGFWHRLRRRVDPTGRYALRERCEVLVLVTAEPGTDVEDRRVRVRFTLRLREARRRRVQGAVGGLAVAGVIVAAGLSLHGVPAEAIVTAVGGLTGVTAVTQARANYRRALSRAEDALARFLDALEHERVPRLP